MSIRLPQMPPRRHALLTAILLAIVNYLSSTPGWARGVRVRGDAQLAVRGTFLGDGHTLEVTVRATDDATKPLARVWVEVTTTPPSPSGLSPCPQVKSPTAESQNRALVRTDERGTACFRLLEMPARGFVRARFAGDALHGAAETSFGFDSQGPKRIPLELTFAHPSVTADLGSDAVAVEARIHRVDGTPPRRGGLAVKLGRGVTEQVGHAESTADGALRFTVSSEKLGGPGVQRLRAQFAGDEEYEGAAGDVTLVMRAPVSLRVEKAPHTLLAEEDFELEVAATQPNGSVDGGVVQLSYGPLALASAPVVNGTARISATMMTTSDAAALLSLRYTSSTPHLVPGAPLLLEIPIGAPGFAARSWFVVVVVGASAWVFSSWRRSRVPNDTPILVQPLQPGVHATVDAASPGRFVGRVFDAHDGAALAAVELVVRRASLDDDGVLLRCRSDLKGNFAFELPPGHGSELRFEARSSTHSTESRTLPSGGTLTVALVTRRRAALERFARWVRRAGPPFESTPHPTPADVGALAHGRADIERWAHAVERSAYGAADVDAKSEAELRSLEPK